MRRWERERRRFECKEREIKGKWRRQKMKKRKMDGELAKEGNGKERGEWGRKETKEINVTREEKDEETRENSKNRREKERGLGGRETKGLLHEWEWREREVKKGWYGKPKGRGEGDTRQGGEERERGREKRNLAAQRGKKDTRGASHREEGKEGLRGITRATTKRQRSVVVIQKKKVNGMASPTTAG